jgi:hypothetical protein
MAITSNQAETALTWPTFLQRVQLQLCVQALNVYSELNTVTGHAVRAARATAVLNNPTGYVSVYAQAVLTQLTLASTNIAGSVDLDTTDAAIGSAISAVWNGLAGV